MSEINGVIGGIIGSVKLNVMGFSETATERRKRFYVAISVLELFDVSTTE